MYVQLLQNVSVMFYMFHGIHTATGLLFIFALSINKLKKGHFLLLTTKMVTYIA